MQTDVKVSTPEALTILKTSLHDIMVQLITPPPRLKLSEWTEKNIYFGASSPEPGPFRTDRAPYQKGMLDVCGNIRHQRVVIMSAAQIGKSSILLAMIGYYISQEPSPIMYCSSDKSQADSFSTIRLDPCIDESPILRKLIASRRKRDGGNRRSEKKFPGGFVTFVSAKSAHSLRARAIRVLLADEVDSWEHDLRGEGDPVRLAEARTSNFPNRRIILVSTPTVKDYSRIEREFLASDQRYFYVPCPHCNTFQVLKWGGSDNKFGLHWQEKNPSTVFYVCNTCDQHIDESNKLHMMQQGEWRITNPASNVPGFHVSSLYSPWVRWQELVTEWLDAQARPDALAAFANLRLGETWEDRSNVIELAELTGHCHPYSAPVPNGVGIITCGVDVHEDFLEVAVWGWGEYEEAFMLDNLQIVGDTAQQQVWIELKEMLKTTYMNGNNVAVPISQTIIDSGFATEMVYRAVKSYREDGINIIAGKGFDGARAIFEWSRYKNTGKPRLGLVGSSAAKSILYARIKSVQVHGPGYVHFPSNVNQEVLEQILGERKITVFGKGSAPKQIWKKLRARQDQLDCFVYAYAALHSLSPNILQSMPALVQKLSVVKPIIPDVTSPDVAPLPPKPRREYNIKRKNTALFGSSWLK